MQFVVITRDNWAEVARSVIGKRWAERLAVETDVSGSLVYRYSRWPEPKVGRRPPDAWIAQVADILSGRTP